MKGGKTRLETEQQASLKRGTKTRLETEHKRGGDGAHGRTVIDSVFFGRPEQGFYSEAEMTKMGAKVGGGSKKKQQQKQQQKGGDGAHGRTVMDPSFFGMKEAGFHTESQMAKMGAMVGGKQKQQLAIKELTIYSVEGMKQKRQRGGYQNESREQHQRRMKGIITNMIDVSDSKDSDIIEVIKNELKEDQMSKYNKKEAEQILKEFYLFNAEKVVKTKNGFRRFPSDLLKQYIKSNQNGGNHVTLPLTYFTSEIPDKIAVPTQVDNYCDTF
jgi:hypothetical protein